MVQRRDRMKSLNDVLRLPADEFFGYIRGIDYGYMDAEGVVHRISPADTLPLFFPRTSCTQQLRLVLGYSGTYPPLVRKKQYRI